MFATRNRTIVCVCTVTLLVLMASGTSFAQSRIARGNPAADGQSVVYKVIGNQLPVCLALYVLDSAGDLLALRSQYIGALQTVQVTPPPIAHFRTTTVFAIFQPNGGSTTFACNSVPNGGTLLSDPTREPKIYESLSGGDQPVVRVNQIANLVSIVGNICGNNTGDLATRAVLTQLGIVCTNTNAQINSIVQIADTDAIVVFGFEEISFQNSQGGALSGALALCGTPSFQTGGGTFIMSCALPTGGGTFSDQGLH